ncbi:MAG: flagellar biosynthesis anti-sigma factor FlgM [Alteromonas sp.]|jgi:negative regulator of flagellin synthesis FlgM|uniref:Negative regulator of flagellin synthesis n=1 Tax=Alteromonas genovensis TaxID=471225 RepID=A0A6N9TDU3_9ALTE|nr:MULTISPECIES: flagellar biosynthesis anti-sigma factor FlgM [Alteromonas]MAI38521.1 flagellar biosynthesis anti-sigma factor FlgM [Alteromonas sp.]NDW14642.1 flagellar biosynthesis anti-sigma factor FlgM [Alteromonas genovensis]OUX85797.1 MAG: flagellar biosynthesis anti-sigma factor FlgM [Alteromonas sp. TMED35]|tara:strand:- start:103890 stop:104219 length:330 start_codon:yes stop_codon:yes gene_type:complete
MAINNINNGLPKNPVDNGKVSQQNQTQQAQQQATAKTATAAPAPRQDSVSLTQSAQQLNQVQKKGTEAPVNQEKVDRLKKAIQSGDYQINPEVLASKIAKAEAEIFGTK